MREENTLAVLRMMRESVGRYWIDVVDVERRIAPADGDINAVVDAVLNGVNGEAEDSR